VSLSQSLNTSCDSVNSASLGHKAVINAVQWTTWTWTCCVFAMGCHEPWMMDARQAASGPRVGAGRGGLSAVCLVFLVFGFGLAAARGGHAAGQCPQQKSGFLLPCAVYLLTAEIPFISPMCLQAGGRGSSKGNGMTKSEYAELGQRRCRKWWRWRKRR
jgi:hypothetical protein